jgi:hypothetical protein
MTAWLRCRVGEGQFRGEYTVTATTLDGAVISMFAPAEVVQPDKHLVRVQLVGRVDGGAKILLPVSPLEVSSRAVVVPAGEVHAQ